LEGMEGTVQEVITEYQGKPLTANCPYKVLFMIPTEKKEQKLLSHLVCGQLLVQALCRLCMNARDS
jgi:Ferredoxin thioredoxin reductase variable alpha chain